MSVYLLKLRKYSSFKKENPMKKKSATKKFVAILPPFLPLDDRAVDLLERTFQAKEIEQEWLKEYLANQPDWPYHHFEYDLRFSSKTDEFLDRDVEFTADDVRRGLDDDHHHDDIASLLGELRGTFIDDGDSHKQFLSVFDECAELISRAPIKGLHRHVRKDLEALYR